MRIRRPLALLAIAAALAVPAAADAARSAMAAPSGLRAFVLRVDEPVVDTFARTPSFGWEPYEGAKSYDFELATSKTFDESSIVWSTSSRAKPLTIPAVSIPMSLPWMTGNPYALYAHVRAHANGGTSPWSTPFGFNMRWKSLPLQITPDYAGLVRWQPVEGATSYEVWFIDAGKVVATTTNVADQREYYSFHQTPTWVGTVGWRVRAVRKLYGTLPNGLPVVSTGPWSEIFTSVNPAFASGTLSLIAAVSEMASTSSAAKAHSLTPGFVFSGDAALDGGTGSLYRVYISTDRQCVNIVYRGSVVGSPAWAPRTTGPLGLPTTAEATTAAASAFLGDAKQTNTIGADFKTFETDEQKTDDGGTSTTGTATTTAAIGAATGATAIPADFKATGSTIDLWDSGWPTGRYYWTVVPVRQIAGTFQYQDAEVPQDVCASGRVAAFGKSSQPATTSAKRPYASGLSPDGELIAASTAKPAFHKAAVIAWAPALGATGYEVQWSKTLYPWKPASATPFYTAATSVLLEGLTVGTWHYRVRGIDPYIPGPIKQMAWSEPVEIAIAKPKFSVVNATVTQLPPTPAKPKPKPKPAPAAKPKG